MRDVVNEIAATQGQTPAPKNESAVELLLLELPFNNDLDSVIVEMLRRVTEQQASWSIRELHGDLHEEFAMPETPPALVLVNASLKKNVARLRSVCRRARELFPDATIMAACWHIDNAETVTTRLKDAGADVVCTTFRQAREAIEHEAAPERKPLVAEAKT